MNEPKYFELHAQTTLDISGHIQPELKPAEPPKGGIFVVSGGEVSWKDFNKDYSGDCRVNKEKDVM